MARCFEGYCPGDSRDEAVYRFKLVVAALAIGALAVAFLYGYAAASSGGLL